MNPIKIILMSLKAVLFVIYHFYYAFNMYIVQTVSIFLLRTQYLCKLYNRILITNIGMVCSSVYINYFTLPKRQHFYPYKGKVCKL